jgi:site-specific DNA-cytosine methylase
LQGHPAPSREKRQGVAASTIPSVAGSLDTECGGGKLTHQSVANGHLVQTTAFYESGLAQYKQADVSGTAKASGGVAGGGSETFIAQTVFEMHGQDSRVRDLGDTCSTVTSKWGTGGGNVPVALQPIAFTTEQTPKYNHDQALTLTKQSPTGGGQPQCVAQPIAFSGCDDGMDSQINVTPTMRVAGNSQSNLAVAVGTDLYNGNITGDVAATMGTPGSSSNASGPTVMQSMAVRRLTPVECERLQGFPDSYTLIPITRRQPIEGQPCVVKMSADGPRYKALGNSMAVPVMAWIGQRIEQVEAICKQNK